MKPLFNAILEFVSAICPKESKRNIAIVLITSSMLVLAADILAMTYLHPAVCFVIFFSLLFALMPIHITLYGNLKHINIQKDSYRRKEFNKGKIFVNFGMHWCEFENDRDSIYIRNLINSGITYEMGGPTEASKLIEARKKKLSNIK